MKKPRIIEDNLTEKRQKDGRSKSEPVEAQDGKIVQQNGADGSQGRKLYPQGLYQFNFGIHRLESLLLLCQL